MLKKHFHKILCCLIAFGITSLQAAQKDPIKSKVTKHLVGNTLIGHTNGVERVVVTSDNRYIVSASLDKTIRI